MEGCEEDAAFVADGGVGATVTFEEPRGVGMASDPPGAVEGGGVDEPHATKSRAATAGMTSRVGTDRAMAVDLTDKE